MQWKAARSASGVRDIPKETATEAEAEAETETEAEIRAETHIGREAIAEQVLVIDAALRRRQRQKMRTTAKLADLIYS